MPDDMQHDQQRGVDGGTRPVPDPTVLTTEALQREIGALRELVESKVDGAILKCDQKAHELDRHMLTKFEGVAQQFKLVETQRVEQKQDTKAAVDAAFNAAAEAVKEQTTASERSIAKSETAVKEQLNQLATTFTTAIDSMRREAGDLKDRINAVEQRKMGAQEQTQVTQVSDSITRDLAAAAQSRVYGAAAILVALAAAAIAAFK